MPTTPRRLTAAAAALAATGTPLALAAPAHAAPAHPSVSYATCQFRDGAAAEIDATWFIDGGGKSVLEQVYRTAAGGGDLEVTYNHYGSGRGPGGLPVTWYAGPAGSAAVLSVTVTDDLGAQCHRELR